MHVRGCPHNTSEAMISNGQSENAYNALTTSPRRFRDPKMCLRNMWTAPYCRHSKGESPVDRMLRSKRMGLGPRLAGTAGH